MLSSTATHVASDGQQPFAPISFGECAYLCLFTQPCGCLFYKHTVCHSCPVSGTG